MPAPSDVLAAGVVVHRPEGQVLLVHRPLYDDWSFPKGKLDPGEHPTAAACREVAEETGVRVRLGPPLPERRHSTGARMKTVLYWVGWPTGDDDVSGYLVNEEVDQVGWLAHDAVRDLLTYPHDQETLAASSAVREKSRAIVVLRHGAARTRESWLGDDQVRPLLRTGHEQAQRLVPVLAAYDVTRVVTSVSTRCVQSVTPYAETAARAVEGQPGLSEEQATVDSVRELVAELVAADDGAVLCTHQSVLPTVCDALGVPDAELDPGGLLVVHHREGAIVASEQHRSV